jgi:hypothetical protein
LLCFFASHGGTEVTERLSPLAYASGYAWDRRHARCACSCFQQVVLWYFLFPKQASFTEPFLDLDDGLNSLSNGPFQFG